MSQKVIGLQEERGRVEAELNGSAPPATRASRDAAKEAAKQWVHERATAKDWQALVACLIPDPVAIKDFSNERTYIDAQQYDADIKLRVAVSDREHPNDAAAAGHVVLEAYGEHPTNGWVAKVAIRLAEGASLEPPEPLMGLAMRAGSMVRKFNDDGLYASRQPGGLSSFLCRQ